MSNWKNSPLGKWLAISVFVVVALSMLYADRLMFLDQEGALKPFYFTRRSSPYLVVILPFYLLYYAARLMRVRDYKESEYQVVWKRPSRGFAVFSVIIVLLGAGGFALLTYIEQTTH